MPRTPYANAANLDQAVTQLIQSSDFSLIDLTESLARLATGVATDLLRKDKPMPVVRAWNGLAKNLTDAVEFFDGDMESLNRWPGARRGDSA